ncbi:MAG TPA: gas vesicle protein GvpD P-loop domain-containing protein [Methanomassiliicoccales archaeon]|jgi:KaiC/GvpD/RAD55 family RecA-like ATPase
MLPEELRKFFLATGGHSLILRGNAGVGKTTFALQAIEEIDEIDNSFYFSTRVSDALLLTQFPWLADKVYGEDVGESIRTEMLRKQEEELVQEAAPATSDEESEGPKRPWFSRMKLVWGTGINLRMGQNLQQTRVELAPLEKIYEALESCGSERTLVVVDSVDAMAETCGINQASLITTIQKDLVERRRANFIFILESNDRYLDYLGDGVIEMSVTDHHRRRLREMSLLKLRGTQIGQPKYLFTLNGARIRTFPDRPESMVMKRRWTPIPDVSGRVSLGLKDLDRMMQNGILPGSIVLVELGPDVPPGACSLLEQSMVANFASLGRGVLWLPTKKETSGGAKERMNGLIGDERFARLVRIPEVASQIEGANDAYIMPVEGNDVETDLRWKSISFSLKGTSTPLLSIIGFDTLESIYGANVMDSFTDHVASVKRNKAVLVGFVSHSGRSRDKLVDLATHRIRLDRIGGTTVVYCVEPFTECNAIVVDRQGDNPEISLVPIV